MKTISRYISSHVIGAIFLVLLILIGLEIFIEFTHEFRDIGVGYYDWGQALLYIPMMLPQDIYQFFPVAGLMGSLIGLGILASNSELIVIRASGVSVLNITWTIIKVGLLLTMLMVVVGEVLAPISQNKAMQRKSMAMNDGQTILTRSGVWTRSGDNFIHINVISADGKDLASIVRYQFDRNNQLKLASYADRGAYKDGSWVFYNIAQTIFKGDRVSTEKFSEQKWNVDFNPHLLGITNVDPEQKSLPSLRAYIKYRYQAGLEAAHYELAFWQRLAQPFSILVMILLGIPFVFGNLRRVTMGVRILVGISVGFSFYLLNQFMGPLSLVYQFSPAIVAFLPTLIFATIGIFLLARVR